MKTKTYSTGQMRWTEEPRRWRWVAWGLAFAAAFALGLLLAVVF